MLANQKFLEVSESRKPLLPVYMVIRIPPALAVGRRQLSVREGPSVYAREIMRISNGDRLELREDAPGWWQVLSINGNAYGARPGYAIGYVSAQYVQVY